MFAHMLLLNLTHLTRSLHHKLCPDSALQLTERLASHSKIGEIDLLLECEFPDRFVLLRKGGNQP
jgi:hypothetical protein